jgi:hypothetical protein
VEALAAQVVLPPFEHGAADVASERRGGGRDVLCEKLLLQSLRGGGDDDALPRGQRRHDVGKTFSRACSRLGKEVLPTLESLLDGLRKLRLFGPRLEARECAREGPGRSEERPHATMIRTFVRSVQLGRKSRVRRGR